MKRQILLVLTVMVSLLLSLSALTESDLAFSSTEDPVFRILIIADPQDTDHPQQAMLNLLQKSLDTAQPDLVVFLGDMIHGPSIHGEENVKKAIDAIV